MAGVRPVTDKEKSGYAEAVFEAVWKRSGQPARIISCLEWDLLRSWMDADYPLRIVLRGIEDTKKRSGNLVYYGGSVREAMRRWLSVM